MIEVFNIDLSAVIFAVMFCCGWHAATRQDMILASVGRLLDRGDDIGLTWLVKPLGYCLTCSASLIGGTVILLSGADDIVQWTVHVIATAGVLYLIEHWLNISHEAFTPFPSNITSSSAGEGAADKEVET